MNAVRKVLVFSADDLPAGPQPGAGDLVIEYNGEPHRVRSSKYLPVGQVHVVDVAGLDLDAVLR